MDRQRAGVLACSVISLCGLTFVGVGLLDGDDTAIVVGSSVMMMAGAAMAALSTGE